MKVIVLCLMLLTAGPAYARQLYTVNNGNWADPAVWNLQQLPDSINDTLTIYHDLTLTADITLGNNTTVFVMLSAGFCGDYAIYMRPGSYMLVDSGGYVGVYYWQVQGRVVTKGCIDVGEGGFYLFGGGVVNKLPPGYVSVHFGRQMCYFPCVPYPTPVTVDTFNNAVVFNIQPQPGYTYYYNFGDGHTLSTDSPTVRHSYPSGKLFTATVYMRSCCHSDSVSQLLYFPPVAQPDICVETPAFTIYPNPAVGHFWLEKFFCQDETVTVSLFTMRGQLAGRYTFATANRYLMAQISTTHLAEGCYIVQAQSARAHSRQKLVVINH